LVVTTRGSSEATITERGAEPRRFRLGERLSPHIRHWHKYVEADVASHHRFFFRSRGGLTGRSAGNLAELYEEIRRSSPDVLRHHAAHHDFSRWIRDVFRDARASDSMRAHEDRLSESRSDAELAAARAGFVDRLRESYLLGASIGSA
jgi:hypothetical protein